MKIGFLITARLKSSRLKQKILLDLNGKKVIERVIERCLTVSGIDQVVLCTSVNTEDDPLIRIAEECKVLSFRGSEEDVMDRLLCASELFGFDSFLSITADNPLFSVNTSSVLADWMKTDRTDFITTTGLPIGCATYAIDSRAMRTAIFMKKELDTEIWGPFINRPDFFKVGELKVTNSPFGEEKRITCDYPEDYELFKRIYELFPPEATPDLKDVLLLLEKKPEIWGINAMHTQRQLDPEMVEKINTVFEATRMAGKAFAASLGLNLLPGKQVKEFPI